MPLVTVDSRPNGEPDGDHALTHGQVTGLADGGRGQARDVLGLDQGGVGERVGAEHLCLGVAAVVERDGQLPPSAASSTTWLLVRIWPSELRMMPEPEPAPWLPLTSILTTEGSTLAATDSTLPSVGGGVRGVDDLGGGRRRRRARGAGRVVVVPGGVGRGATHPGAPADQQGGGHDRAREGHPAAASRRLEAVGRDARTGGSGDRGRVVHSTTMAGRSVTILRPRWVSRRTRGARWQHAAMLRATALALTAALVLCSGPPLPSSATVARGRQAQGHRPGRHPARQGRQRPDLRPRW